MKLLFVADHLKFGGAERHLVTLSAGLAARGHQVAVAHLKDEGELGADLADAGVRVLCCGSRGGLDLAALARLTAAIDAERPDLVVATSQYSNMFAALARRRARRRPALAFICHSMGVVQRGGAAKLRFIVYRQFYRMAECVIFVSALQRTFFGAKAMGIRRAEVVHNGIDLRHFAYEQVAARVPVLRAQYGLARSDLVIGLCAVFREEKRHTDLLEAIARLRTQGVPARAVLVGDGPLRPQIEAAIDHLGLRGSVVLAGFQSDVRPFIAMCDAMALTSHSETFPIATLEYMAFGRALVASDVGGMREQVADGVNGLLYPAGDIAALSAALSSLADPALRSRLGQGALATVRERFSEQLMLARYERLFQQLARTQAAPQGAPETQVQ
jgi:glycosyltransferase involved in cell wall biosynthesis